MVVQRWAQPISQLVVVVWQGDNFALIQWFFFFPPQIIPDPSGKLKYFDKLNWSVRLFVPVCEIQHLTESSNKICFHKTLVMKTIWLNDGSLVHNNFVFSIAETFNTCWERTSVIGVNWAGGCQVFTTTAGGQRFKTHYRTILILICLEFARL